MKKGTALGLAWNLSWTMLFSLLLPLLAGIWLDKKLDTAPLFILMGGIAAFSGISVALRCFDMVAFEKADAGFLVFISTPLQREVVFKTSDCVREQGAGR